MCGQAVEEGNVDESENHALLHQDSAEEEIKQSIDKKVKISLGVFVCLFLSLVALYISASEVVTESRGGNSTSLPPPRDECHDQHVTISVLRLMRQSSTEFTQSFFSSSSDSSINNQEHILNLIYQLLYLLLAFFLCCFLFFEVTWMWAHRHTHDNASLGVVMTSGRQRASDVLLLLGLLAMVYNVYTAFASWQLTKHTDIIIEMISYDISIARRCMQALVMWLAYFRVWGDVFGLGRLQDLPKHRVARIVTGLYLLTQAFLLLTSSALNPNEFNNVRSFLRSDGQDDAYEFIIYSICRPMTIVYTLEMSIVMIFSNDNDYNESELYNFGFLTVFFNSITLAVLLVLSALTGDGFPISEQALLIIRVVIGVLVLLATVGFIFWAHCGKHAEHRSTVAPGASNIELEKKPSGSWLHRVQVSVFIVTALLAVVSFVLLVVVRDNFTTPETDTVFIVEQIVNVLNVCFQTWFAKHYAINHYFAGMGHCLAIYNFSWVFFDLAFEHDLELVLACNRTAALVILQVILPLAIKYRTVAAFHFGFVPRKEKTH